MAEFERLLSAPWYQDYLKRKGYDPASLGSQTTTPTTTPTTTTTASDPAPTGTTPTTPDGMTAEELNMQQITEPALPPGSTYEPINQTPNQEELLQGQQIDPNAGQITDVATADQVQPAEAATYDAAQIGENVPQGDAAQGQVSDQSVVEAAQGTLSDPTMAEFDAIAQELASMGVDPRATVRFQYAELMDFGPDEVPAWAKGAVSYAQQQMAARGLGASSIAAEGITAALMQAALPIAVQDAKVFENMQLTLLDKRMQSAFLKAGYLAQMDLTNLNNRQQAAVINAQSFLQMDMANLSNRQQMSIVNTQARLQSMLSDQAANNAAAQFNAQSQNQIDMFYSNLQAQIDTFNAAQLNEIGMFNAQMFDLREQFNVKNALLIEQSNAQYLRDINTQNTAMQNQANYINSQNLLEISNTAFANAIQLLRDREAYAFEMTENERDRALARYLEILRAQNNLDLAQREEDAALGSAIGQFTSNLIGGVLDNWDSIFG